MILIAAQGHDELPTLPPGFPTVLARFRSGGARTPRKADQTKLTTEAEGPK